MPNDKSDEMISCTASGTLLQQHWHHTANGQAEQIPRLRTHRRTIADREWRRRLCAAVCHADFTVNSMNLRELCVTRGIVGHQVAPLKNVLRNLCLFFKCFPNKRSISVTFCPLQRCAKDIDTLIESLPNEESSQEIQAQSFRRLEVENQDAAKLLEEVGLVIFN